MKKLFAFLLMVLFMSSTALAYDDLVSNDWGLNFMTPGAMEGGLGLLYMTAGDRFDADGESQSLADDSTDLRVLLKGEYGIIEKLSAFVILPFDKWDMGDAGESGLADFWIGAKYSVLPFLHLRGALDLPIGDDEKGLGNAGGFGIDVAAAAGKKVDKLGYRAQVGVRYNGEDGDTKWKPGLGIYLEGGVGYWISEALMVGVGLEIMNVGDGQQDGNDADDTTVNWIDLGIGCSYDLNESFSIGGGIRYDLTGKNTTSDLGIAVGLSYRYGE